MACADRLFRRLLIAQQMSRGDVQRRAYIVEPAATSSSGKTDLTETLTPRRSRHRVLIFGAIQATQHDAPSLSGGF